MLQRMEAASFVDAADLWSVVSVSPSAIRRQSPVLRKGLRLLVQLSGDFGKTSYAATFM